MSYNELENLYDQITCCPLTPERWEDFTALFGPQGGYGGCWCMFWRLKRSQWSEQKGVKNKHALKEIVDSGEVPGILAYAEGQPVGWCSIAPRESFSSLERSRKLRRIDGEPVWSIVCFYVAKPFRRKGVTEALLQAAIKYVDSRGGSIIEGYPVTPEHHMYDASLYMGVSHAFRNAGFVEVAAPSGNVSVMRYYLSV